MNKQRRERLAELSAKLDAIACELDDIQMEEHESFDALPEGLQQSCRGVASEQAASRLEDAVSSVRDAVDAVQESAE